MFNIPNTEVHAKDTKNISYTVRYGVGEESKPARGRGPTWSRGGRPGGSRAPEPAGDQARAPAREGQRADVQVNPQPCSPPFPRGWRRRVEKGPGREASGTWPPRNLEVFFRWGGGSAVPGEACWLWPTG